MRIRRAREEDARDISRIKRNTIKYVNGKDYGKSQIEVWLERNLTKNIRSSIKNGKDLFVAIENNELIGMGSISLKNKMIKSLYVNHKIRGKGTGSKILRHMEKYALKNQISVLKLKSSITAFDFYKAKGYRKIKNTVQETKNVKIPCILMRKTL